MPKKTDDMVKLRSKENVKTEENVKSIKPIIPPHKVFFLNAELCSQSSDEASTSIQLTKLRNPCTGEPSQYILQTTQQTCYELLSYDEPMRSWFINDILAIDGSIYITTQIDPLFLALNYLQENSNNMYVPLDQLLKDDKYPDIQNLCSFLSIEQLSLICDQKGPADLKAVKYNEDKTLKWLGLKCIRLRDVLKMKKFYVDGGAKSETFVVSEKIQTEHCDEGLLQYSIGMISEYISNELSEKLCKKFGICTTKVINIKSNNNKRKSTTEVTGDTLKKIKSENDEVSSIPSLSTTSKLADKKESAKVKAMKKAATGSKNIMSFFGKK